MSAVVIREGTVARAAQPAPGSTRWRASAPRSRGRWRPCGAFAGATRHRPGELSYAQYGLLFGLAERGERSASELAGLADVAPATATQMLDSLVAPGFVERTRSDRDRRLVLVSLTARGSELVAARRARYEALWARALAGFSEHELATATAVLDRA